MPKPKYKTYKLVLLALVISLAGVIFKTPVARAGDNSLGCYSTNGFGSSSGFTGTISAGLTGNRNNDNPITGKISWGDTSTTNNTLRLNSAGSLFPITANHTYATAGVYPVTWEFFSNDGDYCPLSYTITITAPTTTGTIEVFSNVATSWTINGPMPVNGTGTSGNYPGEATGTYSISALALAGYTGPTVTANPSDGSLCNGCTLTFTLNYTAQSGGGTPTPTPTGRYKCNNNACTFDPNDSGPNQCNTDADCAGNPPPPPGDYECSNNSCVFNPNGFGPSTCSTNADCATPPANCTDCFGNNSQFIDGINFSNGGSYTVIAGTPHNAIITLTNTGTDTWLANSTYKLGAQNQQDNTYFVSTAREVVSSNTSTNQLSTFNFPFTAPTTPGQYNFQWSMVIENWCWFFQSKCYSPAAGPDDSYTPLVTINVVADQPAIGSFDRASCTDLAGWAEDFDDPGTASTYKIYNGTSSGTLIASGTAAAFRADVGNHAFDISTPASLFDGVSHTLHAYAVDVETGLLNEMSSSPKTLTCGGTSDPSNVTYTAPNYCNSGPGGTISWTYNDPGNSPQSAYEVQITNTGSFNNPLYDSGKVLSTSNNFSIPNGTLAFNTTYKAEIKTWNSYGNASNWVVTNSFKTPSYAYPQVGFIWSPAKPAINSSVQFTDQTVFGGGSTNNRSWSWSFGDSATSTQENPTHTYTTAGSYTINLTVTDSAGQSCSTSVQIIGHPGPTCTQNSDCPSGDSCQSGICVAPSTGGGGGGGGSSGSCTQNSDCPTGATCQSGICQSSAICNNSCTTNIQKSIPIIKEVAPQ